MFLDNNYVAMTTSFSFLPLLILFLCKPATQSTGLSRATRFSGHDANNAPLAKG
jgi:hypothetical protein